MTEWIKPFLCSHESKEKNTCLLRSTSALPECQYRLNIHFQSRRHHTNDHVLLESSRCSIQVSYRLATAGRLWRTSAQHKTLKEPSLGYPALCQWPLCPPRQDPINGYYAQLYPESHIHPIHPKPVSLYLLPVNWFQEVVLLSIFHLL